MSTPESELDARRMAAIGRLAAGIAHDFNNVLAAIRGYGQIALRSLDAMSAERTEGRGESIHADRAALAQVRADVAAMNESAARGAALARQLAALSRPAGGEVGPLDLNAFAAELHGLMRRLIPAQIELRLSLATSAVVALVDHARLLHAMLELMLDVRDALPAGGRLTIETSVADDDPRTGARRAATLLLRHSAPADAAPSPRTRRVVAELAAEAGGTASVGDVSPDGATVRITLPAARPSIPAPSPDPGARGETRAPAERGATTLLLVEDDPAVRRIARTVLERLGYRVVPAADGREALRLVDLLAADDIVPDLLVTDVTMPAMTGPELATELRRRAPGIGVLFMSGMGDPASVAGGPAGPREAFLEKPFTLDDLAAQVARLVVDRP